MKQGRHISNGDAFLKIAIMEKNGQKLRDNDLANGLVKLISI